MIRQTGSPIHHVLASSVAQGGLPKVTLSKNLQKQSHDT